MQSKKTKIFQYILNESDSLRINVRYQYKIRNPYPKQNLSKSSQNLSPSQTKSLAVLPERQAIISRQVFYSLLYNSVLRILHSSLNFRLVANYKIGVGDWCDFNNERLKCFAFRSLN